MWLCVFVVTLPVLVVTPSERAFYALLVFSQSSFYERFRAGADCALTVEELLENMLASFDRFY